ncbi:DUF4179 domain-containing protein [Ferdinandcohnia sp. Marseille-Q9671]
MEKDLRNSFTREIDIPTEELNQAISRGIERGERYRKSKKYIKPIKRTSMFTAGAAAMVLISGFMFAPVTNVLAHVPIIGDIYANYQMPIGQELAEQQLITELNQTVENNGVKMSITSIFYDGAYVGLTFKATGKNLSDSIGGDTGPESGYTYEMVKGDDSTTWPGTMGSLTKQGNDYVGAIILENPDLDQPSSLNLPITFTHMAGVRGEWSFQLSAKKLPSKEIDINQAVYSAQEEYSVELKNIQIGKTNALITYEARHSDGKEVENLHFEIVDNHGEKVSLSTISDSKVIFEMDSKQPPTFLLVKPFYQIGKDAVELDEVKVELK